MGQLRRVNFDGSTLTGQLRWGQLRRRGSTTSTGVNYFDGVYFDGVYFDGVYFDGVYFDGVYFDGVYFNDLLLKGKQFF